MKPALIFAAVALAVFAWMFRYDVVPVRPVGAIKLDRWTGATYFGLRSWERIEDYTPPSGVKSGDDAPSEGPPVVRSWEDTPAKK